jgi:hypothetical protein
MAKAKGRKAIASSSKSTARKTRKTRKDATVGSVEKKLGLPPGTIRNSDGRDTRSDKTIGTIRKDKDMVMTSFPRPPKKR